MTSDSKLGADTGAMNLNPNPNPNIDPLTSDSKLGADTDIDPLNRVPQTVSKTDKTAGLCYLERPTPVSSS